MQQLSEPEQTLLTNQLRELIERRELRSAKELLANQLEPDAAELISELTPEHRLTAFNLLPIEKSPDTFTFLPREQQEELIESLRGDVLSKMLNEMEPDDRALMLEEFPEEFIQKLLQLIEPEERKATEQMLEYPADSVGRLIVPYFVSLSPDWTAAHALEHIRTTAQDFDFLTILYVVDQENRLIDDLRLRSLILANPFHTIRSLLDGNCVSLNIRSDREEAVATMGRYDLPALPIVDEANKLLGIVTFDDIADVAVEEATEDFQKGGAVEPLDTSYGSASIWSLVQRRIGWLMILVVVSLFSSGVIAAYEKVLTSMVVLTFFIPLLIASGGNAGSQSATLLVRALATDDIKRSQWLKTFLKEISVGVLLGAILGVAGYWLGVARGGNEIGLVVGLSMMSIVVVTNLIGVVLPFILLKLRVDPAVAGSPLVTSIADSVGLTIYFFIATRILGT